MSAAEATAGGDGDEPVAGARPSPGARLIAPFATAWGAVAGRISRFVAAPGWRRTKTTADWVLLIVVAGAVGWTLCSSVFLGTRAVANRGVAVVHLGGQPEVLISWSDGSVPKYPVLPGEVLTGNQTAHVSISIANDSPDGIVISPATLTGPYLSGPVKLQPDNGSGYILGNGTIHYVGTVNVDCDAAAAVARTMVDGGSVPREQPTAIDLAVRDTNKVMHKAYLVIDTTAAAIQGRVCTR